MNLYNVTGEVKFKDGRVATTFVYDDIKADDMAAAEAKARQRAAGDLGIPQEMVNVVTVSTPTGGSDVAEMQDGGVVAHPWPLDDEGTREHLIDSHNYQSQAGVDEDISYTGMGVRDIHRVHHSPFAPVPRDHNHPDMYQEGAAVVEAAPSGVPAIIGEAGPEAVIPLDDPVAVEVMAEAIEEGGAAPEAAAAEAVEAAAEATEAAAEAVEAVAEQAAVETIAEEGAPEAAAEVAETEAVAEAVEAIAEDTVPDPTHPWYRSWGRAHR